MATQLATSWTPIDTNKIRSEAYDFLSRKNSFFANLYNREANDKYRHTIEVFGDLPDTARRKLGRGYKIGTSGSSEVDFQMTGRVTAFEMDRDVVRRSRDPMETIGRGIARHLEAMRQARDDDVLYETKSTPDSMNGFMQYYNSSTSGESAKHVISGGATGTAKCQSIIGVVTGPGGVFTIHPEGIPAGIEEFNPATTDGAYMRFDAPFEKADGTTENTGRMISIGRDFAMSYGLVVPDWRCGFRVANLEISALKADQSSGPKVPELVAEGVDLLKDKTMEGNEVHLFASRPMIALIRRQILREVGNSTLTLGQFEGEYKATDAFNFLGYPLHVCDAMDKDEAVV